MAEFENAGAADQRLPRHRRVRWPHSDVDQNQTELSTVRTGADMDSASSLTYKPSSKKTNYDPYLFGLSFVLICGFAITVAVKLDGFLPRIETETEKDVYDDILKNVTSPSRFSTYQAFDHLRKLSGIGPKVVGTYENEIAAVEFLTRQIENIIGISRRNPHVTITYDKQIVSSCFGLNLKRTSRTLCYENIQNIVVKVQTTEAQTAATTPAEQNILINCHFDSVYTSPGASDDGLHCAVMLEILRTLASTDKRLKKNVIFLFNGAEEEGLLASHGFVTQHKWARNIMCFINLEACGAGGREILFQTGPMAYILPKIYSVSVPYPHGNVIGEELFQSGLIPSDTDFRIFRDFGNLKGLDFAHYKNGYVYHTQNDDINQISEDVIYHTGANIVALLNALLAEDSLREEIARSDDQAVFFDVFGRYMICYTTYTSVVVNLAAVVLSIYSITRVIDRLRHTYDSAPTAKNIAYYGFVNISRFVVGTFVAYFVLSLLSALLRWRNVTMLWYSNHWFVATYYGIPTLLCVVCGQNTDNIRAVNREQLAELFVLVVQTLITLLVLGGTLFQTRVTYILVIFLVPLSVSALVRTVWMKNKSVTKKFMTHVACNLIASLYVAYVSIQLFAFIIPIMGRCGAHVDSERLIRCFGMLITYGVFVAYIPFANLATHLRKLTISVAVCYALYVIYVLFVSSSRAFTVDRPQRISILHVHRKYFTNVGGNESMMENSGYLLAPMDMRGPQTFRSLLDDFELKSVERICNAELYCALPAMFPYMMNSVKSSYWVDAPRPMFPTQSSHVEHNKLEFNVVNAGESMKIYEISIEGPALADFVILPLNGARLVEWSFYNGSVPTNWSWLDNETYLVRRSRGLIVDKRWSFWLKFDVSGSNATTMGDVFKLSWSRHYRLNNTLHFTSGFRRLLNRFPSWTRVVAWVVDYEEYLFK